MARFRRRSPVVDAYQAAEGRMSHVPGCWRDCDANAWMVRTERGYCALKPGDWVIVEDGRRRVIGDKLFRQLYEPFEEIAAPSSVAVDAQVPLDG